MPNKGDTFRTATAINPQIVDLEQKGADQNWDFSGLIHTSTSVDTYVSLDDVPSIYRTSLVFTGANLAKVNRQNPGETLPAEMELGGLYSFYNKSKNGFSKVAYGISLPDFDIPLLFTKRDRIYKFPLSYQDTDSSSAFYSFPPSMAPTPDSMDLYFERKHQRIDTVDAWGTLITPLDTFETIRVKSVNIYNDSIFANGAGQNVPPYREIQYKWLAKGMGVPVLQANAQKLNGASVVTEVTYQALPNTDTSHESSIEEKPSQSGKLYPNPSNGLVKLKLTSAKAGTTKAMVYNYNGQRLQTKSFTLEASKAQSIELDFQDLPKGQYLLHIQRPDHQQTFHQLVIE